LDPLCIAEIAQRKPSLLYTLLGRFSEENIDPVEGDRANADDCARGNSAPQDIAAGKIPDRQQGSKYSDQNAGARNPEGHAPH